MLAIYSASSTYIITSEHPLFPAILSTRAPYSRIPHLSETCAGRLMGPDGYSFMFKLFTYMLLCFLFFDPSDATIKEEDDRAGCFPR